MGFPFWLRNWCEKEISWYGQIKYWLQVASVYRWLFIIEWFNNVLFCKHCSEEKDQIAEADCKVVNGTMIFNGNFIANWNSSESGQISLILWDLLWYAPNYSLSVAVLFPSRTGTSTSALLRISENCNWN